MCRYILICLVCFSCINKEQESFSALNKDYVTYAHGFSIEQFEGIYKVAIKQQESDFIYWLIPKGDKVPDSLSNKQIIRIPVEEIVVTSTSHIPMLDYLDETTTLVGFPTLEYVSSEKMRSRIDSGFVKELGRDNALNFESLVSLQPELVMTYMLTGDRNQLERIENAGIPVMINADYLEQHPLGRAEWIKVAGVLFNKKEQADSTFNSIAEKYNEMATRVKKIDWSPTVMTGVMYGDTWYLPGGANYAAHLFKDAGMDYLWGTTKEKGFLQLSFETIYAKAGDADLWIGTASINKLEDLKNTDSRYTWFKAFKEGEVYTYTKRMGPTGGNEYLELGYLRPDIILTDLVQIAHPKVLEERELFFYEKLE